MHYSIPFTNYKASRQKNSSHSTDTRFHDLRHSYAVNALQVGDGVKEVQEQLGHFSAAFTLDVYGDVSKTMRRESQARMEALIHDSSKICLGSKLGSKN